MGSVPAGKKLAFASGSVHVLKECFAYIHTSCHAYTNDSQDLVRHIYACACVPSCATHTRPGYTGSGAKPPVPPNPGSPYWDWMFNEDGKVTALRCL